MGREMGEGTRSGAGGVGGGFATPEESDGCNDITITGNLPVPRATENNNGFVRNTPPPPKFPDYRSTPHPQHSHSLYAYIHRGYTNLDPTHVNVRVRPGTESTQQETYFTCLIPELVHIHGHSYVRLTN